MAKPLPTNSGVITAGLLRAATSLQMGVYEFKDAVLDDTKAFEGIEATAKEIDRLVRALKKVVE